jgi:hypothetical protein
VRVLHYIRLKRLFKDKHSSLQSICPLPVLKFMIVTYDRNNSSLTYLTTLLAKAKLILVNLALARSVNYDHKVCCKLKCTLQL